MFIRSLKLENVLSFRQLPAFELRQLNIVIGPNGSGKSNLMDCLQLFQSLPNNLASFLVSHGGPEAWMWKGKGSGLDAARVECDFELEKQELQFGIAFSSVDLTLVIQKEWLTRSNPGRSRVSPYLDRSGGSFSLGGRNLAGKRAVTRSDSVLAVYRDPIDKTPITATARAFNDVRAYWSFDTSMNASSRTGVSAAAPKHPLEPNGANLALVLQEMGFQESLGRVSQYLKQLSSRFEEIKFRSEGGRVQLYLKERGLNTFSAQRISDGTLKFLCLMAILLDHDPPRLLCIDEPESGLHPDALRLVAAAMREASERTQLVVTTHSADIVDWFSDEPESVVVCERDFDENTRLKRLSKSGLKEWLKDYTLGDLWRRGELGGKQR